MNAYVRLSKIASTPNGLPAASLDEYSPGSGGVPGKSMPIEYTVEGYIEWPIQVGTFLEMNRRKRNGVEVEGYFRTSIVRGVGPAHIETDNSVYRLEVLPDPYESNTRTHYQAGA